MRSCVPDLRVFSVIEKMVPDAQEMGFDSKKSVAVPKTMVSKRNTIVLIGKTVVSIAGTIACGTSTTVSAVEKLCGG